MNYHLSPQSFIIPALAGILAGFLTKNIAVGVAVFAVTVMPIWIRIYLLYAKDNPKHLWFKRKLYGWGWTPVTWEGWAVTIAYVLLVAAFALTIDGNSPKNEVAFTFILPLILLTITFMSIAYKKGEKPRWQWGDDGK